MRRRDFLRNTSLAGFVATAGRTGLTTDTDEGTDKFVLKEATIHELQAGMASGRYTSKQITELYLRWIKEVDGQGPVLRAIIEFNPAAERTFG